MRFETDVDLERERRAIHVFTKMFGGSFAKLGPDDIDYKVFDKDGKLIAYAEVKGRYKTLYDAFPLPVAVRKIQKLADKRLNPVMIWACEDGIFYGKINELVGEIRWGGRVPRFGAANDNELMCYYENQKAIRYVRYTKEGA